MVIIFTKKKIQKSGQKNSKVKKNMKVSDSESENLWKEYKSSSRQVQKLR